MSTTPQTNEGTSTPQWHPICALDRRVVGVLVEKAKTTPDQYPLTLNALRSGCNQKSNRDPQMNLDFDEFEQSLNRLRRLGAVTEVHDSGRVKKFRHRLYEWLGVDRGELAVMAELLLRGAQTLGELRARTARMEPLADLAALRPLVESLTAKKLVVYLTPQGRGCVVTHALYEPKEFEKLWAKYGAGPAQSGDLQPAAMHREPAPVVTVSRKIDADDPVHAEIQSVHEEIGRLRAELAELCGQVQRISDRLGEPLEQ